MNNPDEKCCVPIFTGYLFSPNFGSKKTPKAMPFLAYLQVDFCFFLSVMFLHKKSTSALSRDKMPLLSKKKETLYGHIFDPNPGCNQVTLFKKGGGSGGQNTIWGLSKGWFEYWYITVSTNKSNSNLDEEYCVAYAALLKHIVNIAHAHNQAQQGSSSAGPDGIWCATI